MWIVLIIVLALIALGVIIVISVRKFPQLASMQIEQSPAEKLKKVKAHIAVERMIRSMRKARKKIIAPEHWARIKYLLVESYSKLKLLEEKYKMRTSEAKVQLLLKRGRGAIHDDPELAEQCFLDILTLDPRNLEAYEALLQIYLAKKNISEAVELLDFLEKLNPASSGRYLFEVASALLQAGNQQDAWKYATQSVAFEPDNPKYLDFLIELAILDKRKREGDKYLEKLREVNPENGKIAEFEKQIAEI